MTSMTAQHDRLEFAAVLGAEGIPVDIIEDTLRDARSLHKLAENDCNYGLTDAQQKREENLQARLAGKLAAYGVIAHFQGDPRGAVVKLRLPSGKSNDFGGEGYFCVPTG